MEAEGIIGDDLEQAVEEWDNVAEVVPEFRVGPSGCVRQWFEDCIQGDPSA